MTWGAWVQVKGAVHGLSLRFRGGVGCQTETLIAHLSIEAEPAVRALSFRTSRTIATAAMLRGNLCGRFGSVQAAGMRQARGKGGMRQAFTASLF
eukprot:363845-Chlamydomonas_euryale.AAC.1